MNREWVEAGARALANKYVGRWTVAGREEAAVVIDAVEPLIRADERDRCQCNEPLRKDDPLIGHIRREVLADLRAKVEGLAASYPLFDGEPTMCGRAFADVLALIDEEQR